MERATEISLNGTKTTILREGEFWAKASKTDPEAQHFIAREIEIEGVDGRFFQYMHPQFFNWVELPEEWLKFVTWRQ